MTPSRSRLPRGLAASFVLFVVALAGCASTTTQGSATPTPGPSIDLPDGFPVGTWTMAITEADLRAAGFTKPGELFENQGMFTKVVSADGTWTITQVAPGPVRWPIFRGTFRPTGPNAFEETTTFPTEYAGEVVKFEYKVEGDELSLTLIEPTTDPLLRFQVEVHPWKRS